MAAKSAVKAKPVTKNFAARIYSTITNSTEFCEWLPSANDIPRKGRSVTIKGGAGIALKQTLITPYGAITEVSAEDLEYLESNVLFQNYVKDGWITITKATGWKDDPDAIAADMTQRDGSSPLVPNDFVDAKKVPSHGASFPNAAPPTTLPRHRPIPGIHNAFR